MLVKFICTAMCIISLGCQATTELNPYQLVDMVAKKTLQRIETDRQQITANPAHLQKVVREELMPYVDHQLASKIVLDKVRPAAELREQFYKAFERYLVATYATIFSKYDGQELSLGSPKSIDGKKVVTVKGKISGLGARDIGIDFKLKLNKQTGQWAVYDMVVEGISMLNSKKAELLPILRQPEGVRTAINILNKKAGSTERI